ncbi:MAG: hypothetical protein K2N70_00405 [Helicobacter sp.]|nr:hypothetical protein [Helicobacter sp.]
MSLVQTLKALAGIVGILVVFVLGAFFTFFIQSSNQQPSQAPAQGTQETQRGLQLSQNLQASIKILPTHFVANPALSASSSLSAKTELSSEDKAAISRLFAQILARAEKENFCSGGSYEVAPSYRFENGQRSIAGFSLHSHFVCKIQKEQLDAYSALLSDIDNLASQSGYAILNIPALEPSYEHELANFKAHQRRLYQDIINQANALAKDYSAILGKTCTPKRIDFGQSARAPMMRATANDMAIAEAASGAAPMPSLKATLPIVQEGREFSASANISLECK